MKYALHGMLTKHSNLLSDIELAATETYDAIEIHTDKLWRYLEAGYTAHSLKTALDAKNMKVSAIDIIGNVECPRKNNFASILTQAQTLIDLASTVGCNTIQLNAFSELDGLDITSIIKLTAKNIRKIALLGQKKNISFQYEGAAWTPIHSLRDCLHLVEEVACDNFGLVIDYWHFWASGKTNIDDIARLDKKLIYNVHCCGGNKPANTTLWPDESTLRDCFPLEGALPAQEWTDAIKATGYTGYVSGELLGATCWEHSHSYNAHTMLNILKTLFKD